MKKARPAAKAAARRTRVGAPKTTRLQLARHVISPAEVEDLESVAKRHADSERAWQRMTSPVEEDPWTSVEEHLLSRRDDSDRSWKFYSK